MSPDVNQEWLYKWLHRWLLLSRDHLTRYHLRMAGKIPRSRCVKCGARDVPLIRWRVTRHNDSGRTTNHQRGLCENCSRPLSEVFEKVVERGDLVTRCSVCETTTRPLRKWTLGRVDPGPAIFRTVHLCDMHDAPVAEIAERIGAESDGGKIRVVKSISELLPSRALYVQQHGGQLPPAELGLK